MNHTKPKHPADFFINQALTLIDSGEHKEALTVFIKITETFPDCDHAHYCIGSMLIAADDYETARFAFLQCLEINPHHQGSLIKIAGSYAYERNIKGCLYFMCKLIEITDDPLARLQAAIYAFPQVSPDSEPIAAAIDGLDIELDRWKDSNTPAGEAIPSMCVLTYTPGDHTERFRRYGQGFARTAAKKPAIKPHGRIRLMIVLAMKFDSVWNIILHGLLTHIDRSLFEVIILPAAFGGEHNIDKATEIVDVCLPASHHVGNMLTTIEASQPDILFYPELALCQGFLSLCTKRLAPLQVVSWGHPITTGFSEIDIFFSGELLESKDADSHYTEKLVRLPGTGALTLTPEPVVPVKLELKAGVTRFVCPNHDLKFDPSDDELFVQIAKEVGHCEFWFPSSTIPGDTSLRRRLIKAFLDGGLDPAVYLWEFQRANTECFAGLLDAMDIYLDCPNFSGYTTAHKAIQRGIPIVTLEGEFMRQRLAAGLLRQIGRTDTIAQSKDDYVNIAVSLAKESPTQRKLRRDAIKAHAPMADNNIDVVRAFEQALIDGLNINRGDYGKH